MADTNLTEEQLKKAFERLKEANVVTFPYTIVLIKDQDAYRVTFNEDGSYQIDENKV